MKRAGVRKHRFVLAAVIVIAAISLLFVVTDGSLTAVAGAQKRPQQRHVQKPKAPPKPKPASAPRVKLLSMGNPRKSGAQWFLRNADRAEVAASQRGYQVYEYYDREGR